MICSKKLANEQYSTIVLVRKDFTPAGMGVVQLLGQLWSGTFWRWWNRTPFVAQFNPWSCTNWSSHAPNLKLMVLHDIEMTIVDNFFCIYIPCIYIYISLLCSLWLLQVGFLAPRSVLLKQQQHSRPAIPELGLGAPGGVGGPNETGKPYNPGMGVGGGGPQNPTRPKPKAKPPPSMTKKAASKVSALSTKLTDLKCLATLIKSSNL